jgi:hypothetical protein
MTIFIIVLVVILFRVVPAMTAIIFLLCLVALLNAVWLIANAA